MVQNFYKAFLLFTAIVTDEGPTADNQQAKQKITQGNQRVKPRKSVVKVVPKPVVGSVKAVPSKTNQQQPIPKTATVQPRLTTSTSIVRRTVKPQTVVQFSNKRASLDIHVEPVVRECTLKVSCLYYIQFITTGRLGAVTTQK